MCWRVRLIPAQLTQGRRALQLATPLAVLGGVTAVPLQVAARHPPVTRTELVHVHGVLPGIDEDRLREPAAHDTPELAIRPTVPPELCQQVD